MLFSAPAVAVVPVVSKAAEKVAEVVPEEPVAYWSSPVGDWTDVDEMCSAVPTARLGDFHKIYKKP